MTDGKNNSWMSFDEEGIMPKPTLDKMARCPYCGRFMKRGLVNFLEHAWGDCPYHKVMVYSPDELGANTTEGE